MYSFPNIIQVINEVDRSGRVTWHVWGEEMCIQGYGEKTCGEISWKYWA